jgi:hypothetical protein
MITCSTCGAQSPDGSTFCAACGKSMAQPTRVITPEAEKAMRQAAAQAHVVVKNLGPEKVASIVGGVLGLLGAVLPFYSIPNVGDLIDTSGVPTPNLVGQGPVGIIVILLALVLGALPFITAPSRMIGLAGFGLSAAVLGMLVSERAGFTFFGQSMVPDFGIGYYAALFGFAILAWVYGQRANQAA